MAVLSMLFHDFSARLCSSEFLSDARHPYHPSAFSRCRKLPPPALLAILFPGIRLRLPAAPRPPRAPRAAVPPPLAPRPPVSLSPLAHTLRSWLSPHGPRPLVAHSLFVLAPPVLYRMGPLRELFGDLLDDPETVLRLTLALAVADAPRVD